MCLQNLYSNNINELKVTPFLHFLHAFLPDVCYLFTEKVPKTITASMIDNNMIKCQKPGLECPTAITTLGYYHRQYDIIIYEH